MELNQNINVQLTQKLTLSPELMQSLEIMQLPLIDLVEKINQELENNPALEIDENATNNHKESKDIYSIEDTFFGAQDYFMDSSSASIDTGVSPDTESSDEQNRFLESAISSKQTLQDCLLEQLYTLNIDDNQKRIGETIISSITQDGFYPFRIKDVFEEKDIADAEDMLEKIQMFEPAGIASYDIREALLFQIESSPKNKLNRNAYIIVNKHFNLLCERKDNALARELGVNINEIKKAITFLSQFNPYPGRLISTEETIYETPDVYISRKDGELHIEINDEFIPSLVVSKTYEKMLEDSKKNKAKQKLSDKKKQELADEQKFITEKITNAKQFINSIKYRNASLYKLAICLLNEQKQFFYMGPKYLKPFTMTQASELIGLSESTISRLASSKYIQTEWGLKQIKYFFTNVATKKNDSDHSSEYVRQLIKEIIDADTSGKISDQTITDALKNKGIAISRRTVNKYRNQMNIDSSHKRNI